MLKKTFDVNRLGDHLLELLADLQNQIEVTITRDGVTLAMVFPFPSQSAIAPKAGLNLGSMVMTDDFEEPIKEFLI